ncbi:HPF/RaiA family ribosome-associated protein [Kutzneria sp. CA-103260]|uniref:HPF/RaiA family ribosome-associated protein n=1 Tax=Kutzneria sp. CA-103260 TaxID=2802641 RepID=UPI001BAB2B8F|nr:sigma 54 modulation/S30EA ribosomal C-terminal domain-containing protein [Kutzneria sp. CA-103260]QUQ64056.1 Ribosome hibernation promoting factor [Kutzneria sp. CA-103260]
MRVEPLAQSSTIDVELGGLAADGAYRVRARILSLARYAPRPIIGGTVRFSTPSDRVRTPVVAHATLAMRGARLVAVGTGATIGEATDRVRTTLRRQLLDLAHGRRKHSRVDDPSTVDETPVVVRHVTRMPACASPEQAVLALDQLGQEFGLHVDATTGREAIVWRNPDGEYGFVTERPTLTETAAIQRLVLTGEPWLFYTDRRTGRGHVAHRRGDHRFGVITP